MTSPSCSQPRAALLPQQPGALVILGPDNVMSEEEELGSSSGRQEVEELSKTAAIRSAPGMVKNC